MTGARQEVQTKGRIGESTPLMKGARWMKDDPRLHIRAPSNSFGVYADCQGA